MTVPRGGAGIYGSVPMYENDVGSLVDEWNQLDAEFRLQFMAAAPSLYARLARLIRREEATTRRVSR